jgi:lipoprotein-anchoring transpeptidase ErfK/SrfK
MSQGKLLPKMMVLLCWSTAISLLDVPQQAIASEVTNTPVNGDVNALTTPPHSLDTRLILKLRERRVYLYQGDRLLESYPVAIGKKGWETPTGDYQVIRMVQDPAWEHPWNGDIVPPGPDNPLGERWIGFWTDGKNTIGFHGTPAENLIGQAVSHGCVRMRNRDIKALFEQVQLGTPVIVQP